MARRIVPKRPPVLFIREWLAIRGMKPDDLAAALSVDKVSVWRYINGERKLDTDGLKAFEEELRLKPGDLFRRPGDADKDVLLEGLPQEAKLEVLTFIEFQQKKHEK